MRRRRYVPSGHTISVTLFAAWAIHFLRNGIISMRMRWLYASAAADLVPAVEAIRGNMGVHYPCGVLGSIVAGAVWSRACIARYPQLERQRLSRSVHGA